MAMNLKWVLAILMMGTSMAAIDSSIVNVSLPVIRQRFGAEIADVEWVVTAYMISFSLFIPLTNWVKKRLGYYTLFLGSVALFTIGSLLCSLSNSLVILVAARVIQAIGGGAISPTSLAILGETFPIEQRGSAIGWWGIGNVMGPALGPTLGGLLTHYWGWQSVFWVNIPIGVLTIILGMRYLKFLRSQPVYKTKLDIQGYTWFAIFIVTIQYTVSLISKNDFYSWKFIAGLGLIALASIRIIRTSRKPDALMDLSVFRISEFLNASLIVIIRSVALYGGMFFLPFLLQGLLGYTALQSGLLMLPNALTMLVSRPYAGRKADEGLIRNISLIGIVLVALSMFFFSRIDLGTAVWLIILPMIIRGLGMSLLVAPVSTSLLNAVRKDQTATATSLNSLLQQVGGSVGIAMFGVFHTWFNNMYLRKGFSEKVAEHFALRDGFLLAAALISLALLPALRLPEKRAVTALSSAQKS